MPELPEVETTRRGLAPQLCGRSLLTAVVRNAALRWPVTDALVAAVPGQLIHATRRRGKYLLLDLDRGTLILHLGMSGSLRVVPSATPPGPHDHVDLVLDTGQCLRLRDPRRFGALLWTTQPAEAHPLLAHLGPEPLGDDFTADYLHARGRQRRIAVKTLIMDSHVVVGVGNIYASEALFRAGIRPQRQCSRIALVRYRALTTAIRTVLDEAIQHGGTTLRDFVRDDGRPGYFAQRLQVYARSGTPCPRCGRPIAQQRIGQRSSFFCPHCQR
jgi:formamidopyrimidine-DNA glycosylase